MPRPSGTRPTNVPGDTVLVPAAARTAGDRAGRHGGRRTDDEAMAAVAGYALVNDVSEREFQNERGGQWTRARTARPSTRWALAGDRDEIRDPQDLRMRLWVNGALMQDSSTAEQIFPWPSWCAM
ncbi:fumarylacetoacetate hydrolase family protein [Streptomyces cinnamoneus]|uniref:fumarylacetoacetate hydrolase family protein n=1 Tax=Streptomyces cinnamoneus TaxID=53446 RepID=UPI0023D907DB|nr:fumarylacetoacetate hydrolase family protein [Streptomyces cinnamoneus]